MPAVVADPAPSFDLPSVAASPHAGPESNPLAWMLTMLRQSMEDVMAADGAPLQKANALSRLGALYLKACRELEATREQRRLQGRIAALEERLATLALKASARAARDTTAPRFTAEQAANDQEANGESGSCREHTPDHGGRPANQADRAVHSIASFPGYSLSALCPTPTLPGGP